LNPLQFKSLFILIAVILGLLVASPALQQVLVYPRTDYFTEVWMLGPSGTASGYPHDIRTGESYSIFLGVSNHLDSCAYYQIKVKLRNETQLGPNGLEKTPSTMPSLYNVNLFVARNETREIPINFSLNYTLQNVTRTIYTNVTVPRGTNENATIQQRTDISIPQANYDILTINGVTLNITGYSSDYSSLTRSVFADLIFEVWIYDSTTQAFQYHNRFVDLKLGII
jgi:uncharacterized membrane protein